MRSMIKILPDFFWIRELVLEEGKTRCESPELSFLSENDPFNVFFDLFNSPLALRWSAAWTGQSACSPSWTCPCPCNQEHPLRRTQSRFWTQKKIRKIFWHLTSRGQVPYKVQAPNPKSELHRPVGADWAGVPGCEAPHDLHHYYYYY